MRLASGLTMLGWFFPLLPAWMFVSFALKLTDGSAHVNMPLAVACLALLFLVFVFMAIFYGAAVDVKVRGQSLVCRWLWKTEDIPFADVIDCQDNAILQPKRLTIRLHKSAKFGTKIRFIAPLKIGGVLEPHPIVAEFNAMLRTAKEGGQGELSS